MPSGAYHAFLLSSVAGSIVTRYLQNDDSSRHLHCEGPISCRSSGVSIGPSAPTRTPSTPWLSFAKQSQVLQLRSDVPIHSKFENSDVDIAISPSGFPKQCVGIAAPAHAELDDVHDRGAKPNRSTSSNASGGSAIADPSRIRATCARSTF